MDNVQYLNQTRFQSQATIKGGIIGAATVTAGCGTLAGAIKLGSCALKNAPSSAKRKFLSTGKYPKGLSISKQFNHINNLLKSPLFLLGVLAKGVAVGAAIGLIVDAYKNNKISKQKIETAKLVKNDGLEEV